MIIADYHTHTEFSTDSHAPMKAMVQAAIAKGLKYLCFTDHMDFDYPLAYGGGYQFNPPLYLKEIERTREAFGDKLAIRQGIELGMQPHLSSHCEELIKAYPFDFVICSSHLIDGLDPYYKEFWENRSIKQAIGHYFEAILENIKSFQNFDVYGHLDYIIRYLPKSSEPFSYTDYGDILDEIVKTLLFYGKGIEINSGGYKYGLGHANPHEFIIKRYLELGGTVLTIGSDAHAPENLAYDFEKTRHMLARLGVTQYTVFQNRTPTFLPL